MDELGACRAIVREAAADPDPWRGFCRVIERVTVLNARNQGFTDAFMAEHPSAIDFAAHRAALTREIAAISRRAIAAGELRADFVLDDFMLVLLAGRGLTTIPCPRPGRGGAPVLGPRNRGAPCRGRELPAAEIASPRIEDHQRGSIHPTCRLTMSSVEGELVTETFVADWRFTLWSCAAGRGAE